MDLVYDPATSAGSEHIDLGNVGPNVADSYGPSTLEDQLPSEHIDSGNVGPNVDDLYGPSTLEDQLDVVNNFITQVQSSFIGIIPQNTVSAYGPATVFQEARPISDYVNLYAYCNAQSAKDGSGDDEVYAVDWSLISDDVCDPQLATDGSCDDEGYAVDFSEAGEGGEEDLSSLSINESSSSRIWISAFTRANWFLKWDGNLFVEDCDTGLKIIITQEVEDWKQHHILKGKELQMIGLSKQNSLEYVQCMKDARSFLFSGYNPFMDFDTCIDLHGLFRKEAVEVLEWRLRFWASFPTVVEASVVTGRGKHSKEGKSILLPYVRNWLDRLEIQYWQINAGCLGLAMCTLPSNWRY